MWDSYLAISFQRSPQLVNSFGSWLSNSLELGCYCHNVQLVDLLFPSARTTMASKQHEAEEYYGFSKRSMVSDTDEATVQEERAGAPKSNLNSEAADQKSNAAENSSRQPPLPGHFTSDGYFQLDKPIRIQMPKKKKKTPKGKAPSEEISNKDDSSVRDCESAKPGYFNAGGRFVLDNPIQLQFQTMHGDDGKFYRYILDGKGNVTGKSPISEDDAAEFM